MTGLMGRGMKARGKTALALLAMTTVSGCGDSPQMAAQRKVFNACQESVASRYPNTCGSGEVCVDVKHIQDEGAGMEQCMAGFSYRYDESKSGCQLPPEYNAGFYQLKSKVACYSSTISK